MPRTDLPSEDEIRTVVRRIVEGVDESPDVDPEPDAAASRAAEPEGGGPIAIGADHGGYRLKEFLAFRLREQEWEVVDCGTHSSDSVDYPEFARKVAEEVASGRCRWGIVVDGAGIGSSIAANKVPGVRAALCYDVSSARNSREHNHANVLTLGAGLIGESLAWQIVDTWLGTPWGGGRHARRVALIEDIERAGARAGT